MVFPFWIIMLSAIVAQAPGLRLEFGRLRLDLRPVRSGAGLRPAMPAFSRHGAAVTLFREACRAHGDRVSMACLPATLRNSASTYALPSASAAVRGSPRSHGRASAQGLPGHAFH